MECRVCNKKLIQNDYSKKQWNYKKNMFKKKGYVYCSEPCSKEVLRKLSSINMAKTNRKYASERMKRNNPMFDENVRKKASLKAKGRKISNRGGNGTGLTEPQKMLLEKIEHLNPMAEFPVKTFKKKGSGYPQHYKIDIAIPHKKVAIEVDGKSHYSVLRKKQDKKKTELLNDLGWKVVRFKNEEILNNLDECLMSISDEVAN